MAPGEANVAPPKVVALIVPEPVTFKDAPEPTSIAAVVFVPEVMALNAELPPPEPQSIPVPLITPDELTCKHCVDPVIPVVIVPEAVKAAVVKVPVNVGETVIAKVPPVPD
jgi:hypothetical protein